jgi:hypothetical protein
MLRVPRWYITSHRIHVPKMPQSSTVQQHAAPGIVPTLTKSAGYALPLFVNRIAKSWKLMSVVPSGCGRDVIVFLRIALVG